MSLLGKLLIKTLGRFSYVQGLEDRIAAHDKYLGFDPGHYYSPVVEPAEYLEQQKLASSSEEYLPPEINFNEAGQTALLESFRNYYGEFPFAGKVPNLRFTLDNVFFTYSDAFTMYSMMRHFKPRNIIEIGSGYSSALILDTNDLFFSGSINLTFIDPNPERLKANLLSGERVNIIEEKIQGIDPGLFQQLSAGDFLLIDTSHVSKSGSDVNFIYFNILPFLKKGVIIHIHDVFFPFEYPAEWIVKENRSWNEIFLLRAFLSFNENFRISFFNSFMEKRHRAFFKENFPIALERNSTVCGGIWIEKIS